MRVMRFFRGGTLARVAAHQLAFRRLFAAVDHKLSRS